LFERPLILRLNLPFAYQKREARRIETNLLWKHQSAFPSLTRRAVCHHDKPRADSVVSKKAMRANAGLQLRRAISIRAERKTVT
jgi:hypothetical protein